jgi:hypothetical protein
VSSDPAAARRVELPFGDAPANGGDRHAEAARTRTKRCRHSRRTRGRENRDADRPAVADVEAVDARSTGVLQADRLGA